MNQSRQLPPPRNLKDAHSNIIYYCKIGSFTEAEWMFQKMCEMINFQPATSHEQIDDDEDDNDNDDDDGDNELGSNINNQWKPQYTGIQIENFQKSIATLIRYAPTIQDSLDYACFCLHQVPEPLRNESLEKIMTINLIYLYKRKGGRDNFTKALALIKTGVYLGYALPPQSSNAFTNNSDAVFVDVSFPVLRYFGLTLSQDKNSII